MFKGPLVLFLISVGSLHFSFALATRFNTGEFFLATALDGIPHRIRLNPAASDASMANDEHGIDTAQKLTLYTKSGVAVPTLFFDRKSDTALVLGQGLPASKESMLEYVKLFPRYDIILFDYRWNDKYNTSLLKSFFAGAPTQQILLDEEDEVRVVLEYLQRHKEYKKVAALGECYSNFLFTKIQHDEVEKIGAGPFTHLILDSCWLDYASLVESICSDPLLPLSPQEGGAPWALKKLTDNRLVRWIANVIACNLTQNASVAKYLEDINADVLFVRGANDIFVKQAHFDQLWHAVDPARRAALLTPYTHSHNLGNKFLYRVVAERFVDGAGIEDLVENCADLCN